MEEKEMIGVMDDTLSLAIKLADKKKILLDLDGTLIEYDFNKIVYDFFGVDISKYIISAYDLADWLGVAPSLIDNMFHEQVWGKPKFMDNALETVNEWYDKYELIIFSNRVKYMGERGLAEWLINNEIPFHGIDNGEGKYFAHIDDRPSKLANTDSKLKLLYTQSWNVECKNIHKNLIRVNSWNEIRRLI
jgi:uncharacterized HAD superfamily protein